MIFSDGLTTFNKKQSKNLLEFFSRVNKGVDETKNWKALRNRVKSARKKTGFERLVN